MHVLLVMFKADGTRRDFPINKPRTIVGRNSTADLRIPLSSVSRQHCEVIVGDDAVRLRDLGSSNGTFQNGKRVQGEAELKAGDEIVIGPVVFTVVIDGKPARIKPVPTVLAPEASESAGRAGAGDEVPADALEQIEDEVAAALGPESEEQEEEIEEAPVVLEDEAPEAPLEDESAAATQTPAAPSAKPPKPAAAQDQADEEEPLFLEEGEPQSPTVDLDDPIAALEAMARKEQSASRPGNRRPQPQPKQPSGSGGDDIPLVADEEKPQGGKKR